MLTISQKFYIILLPGVTFGEELKSLVTYCKNMMNEPSLREDLYSTDTPLPGIKLSLKDKYDKFRITMKTYRKILLPQYKKRIIDMKNRSAARYPCTTFFTAASCIFTPLAALLDPRPVTFAVSLGMAAFGYMTDKLSGAPHPYYPDE